MSSLNLAKILIKQFEGLKLTPYYCPAGRKTVGYGHVIKPHELLYLDTQITEEQAEELLDQDVIQTQIVLYKYCYVHLSINQQVALISFIFNCGHTAFKNSTLLEKLNQAEYLQAADQFPRWVYAKGEKLQGLIKRRRIERAIFLEEINSLLS